MSRKFKIHKDPNNMGCALYKKGTIIIQPGVTVLVGCNGTGKTTLINCLEEKLDNEDIPHIKYNNLTEGGNSSMQDALFRDDISFLVRGAISSEGERIVMNMEKMARKIGEFVRTGRSNDMKNIFADIFSGAKELKKELVNERWIFLDAIDSGLSVDNIVDIKEVLFKTILEHNAGNDIYIIVSANEYEMARGQSCFDVYNGKYITFKDYEEYREFILKSKEIKCKRYDNE